MRKLSFKSKSARSHRARIHSAGHSKIGQSTWRRGAARPLENVNIFKALMQRSSSCATFMLIPFAASSSASGASGSRPQGSKPGEHLSQILEIDRAQKSSLF
jgi:hypothetical protein